MTQKDKLQSGMSKKQENEGRWAPLVGKYVRVIAGNGTSSLGMLHRSNYEEIILKPYLSMLFSVHDQSKLLYAKVEDEPDIYDSRSVIKVSYLGKKAFDKFLEDLLNEKE